MKINDVWKKTKNLFKSIAIEFWENVILKLWRGLSPDKFFPFVGRHFFYLIWILLVPIILYFMAQGRELFTGLFDDSYFFSGFQASFLLAAYFAQGMAIILLPRPFFKDIKFQDWGKVRYAAALNNPGLTYLLSALPVVMFGLVMIKVQADRIPNWAWWLIVPTLVLTFIISARFENKWKLSMRATLLIILANIVFCGLVVSWIVKPNPFWNYFIVGTCLMAQMALIGGLSRRIHEDFRVATNADDTAAIIGKKNTHSYDKLYFWSTIPVVALVIFFMTCPNLQAPTPTFMLLLLTTFYMLITRFIAAWYTFRIKCEGYKCVRVWVFWGVAAFLLYVIFFVKSDIHNIRTIPATTMQCKDRTSLDEWFEAWWAENQFDTTATEIPIYLVGVQGGGSRAGLWTSEMLNRLEVESDYKFHKHCLAITSASGGSVGTGATLALWRFAAENEALVNSNPGGLPKDSLYLNFAKGAFQRNYLSGSFFDIFICEIGSRFMFGKKDRDSRNYRLQKDEALGFGAGLERGFYPTPSRLSMRIYQRLRLWDKGDKPEIAVDGFKVKNYPFMDYLSYWYDESKKPKANLPLYLPISTNIQTGKAAFSSPVRMDSIVFTDAIDVLACVETSDRDRPNRTLTMVGATNLSELFPLMSAFTHIPKAGNFIDGGTYENMGLQVLQQIYFWLDRKRETDPRMAKVRVHVIYLINNQLETANYPKRDRVSQVVSPLKHASSTTIDGRTTYFTKRMAYDLRSRDGLHTLTLQAREPKDINLRIPLGRWLSRRSVRLAHTRADSCMTQIRRIVAPLK
ncbi:MAG: hypothetical protein ACKVUS_09545 [Saprospiraceae bacterium]